MSSATGIHQISMTMHCQTHHSDEHKPLQVDTAYNTDQLHLTTA